MHTLLTKDKNIVFITQVSQMFYHNFWSDNKEKDSIYI